MNESGRTKLVWMGILITPLLILPASAQGAFVSIAEVDAEHGSTVEIPLMVTNVTNLGGGEVNVTYNPSVVHVTGVTPEDMGTVTFNINNVSGWVYVNTFDAQGQSGNVVFANIHFTAVGSETEVSTLNITVYDLFDTGYNDLSYIVTNGTFTVTPSGEPTPTPTPTPTPYTPSNGGSSGRGPVSTTPTPSPTEKPPAVEKAKIISSIEAGKPESVTFEGLDICKISIEVDKNVSDVNVIVEKVDKPEEITDAPGIVYLYYNITATNITNVNVTATIEFKVNKSWMADENVDEAKIKLYRYDEGWETLHTSKINEDHAYTYFSVETQGLSIFAISGSKKVEVITTPSPTLAPSITPSSTTQTPTPTPVPVPRTPPLFLILIVIAVIVIAGIIIIMRW